MNFLLCRPPGMNCTAPHYEDYHWSNSSLSLKPRMYPSDQYEQWSVNALKGKSMGMRLALRLISVIDRSALGDFYTGLEASSQLN